MASDALNAPTTEQKIPVTGTEILPPPLATTPVLSPKSGNYTAGQSITLTDATNGAVIYYTTNGATPTASSTRYAGAIAVSQTTTIHAIAAASGYTNSAVASATYTITLPAATPVISPKAGQYAGDADGHHHRRNRRRSALLHDQWRGTYGSVHQVQRGYQGVGHGDDSGYRGGLRRYEQCGGIVNLHDQIVSVVRLVGQAFSRRVWRPAATVEVCPTWAIT